MKIKSFSTLTLAALALCSAAAQAQTLVTYLNTTTTGTGTATQVDSSITAGTLAFTNLGSSSNAGFSGVNSISNYYVRTDFNGADQAEALVLNRFASFTLTPGANPVTMTKLTFDLGLSSTVTPNPPVVSASAFVRSSLDGYTTTIGTTVGFTDVTAPTNATWGTSRVAQEVNLGSSFQNLTSAVTFRIYLIDNISNTQTSLRFSNIQVVPEPSTFALLGLGLGGVLVTARRRRAV